MHTCICVCTCVSPDACVYMHVYIMSVHTCVLHARVCADVFGVHACIRVCAHVGVCSHVRGGTCVSVHAILISTSLTKPFILPSAVVRTPCEFRKHGAQAIVHLLKSSGQTIGSFAYSF